MSSPSLEKLHFFMNKFLGLPNRQIPKEDSDDDIIIINLKKPENNIQTTIPSNGNECYKTPQSPTKNQLMRVQGNQIQQKSSRIEIRSKNQNRFIENYVEIKSIPDEKETQMEVEESTETQARKKSEIFENNFGVVVSQNCQITNQECLKCSKNCQKLEQSNQSAKCYGCCDEFSKDKPFKNGDKVLVFEKSNIQNFKAKRTKKIQKVEKKSRIIQGRTFKDRTEQFKNLESFIHSIGYKLGLSDQQIKKDVDLLHSGKTHKMSRINKTRSKNNL